MGRWRGFGAVGAVGLAVMLGTAGCGGGGGDDKAGGFQKVGTCQIQPNTSCPGADMAGAGLAGANLSGADLSGANLAGADLTGANLAGANLSGANLSTANLTAAVLTGAMLDNANLSGANLTQANLQGATISGLDDTGATQCETTLGDGSVNDSGCPPAAPVTSGPANATPPPVNLPCQRQPGLFLAVYKSQADNFGFPASVSSATTAVGDPACGASGWATLTVQDPAGPPHKAVFMATTTGWQLVGAYGCSGTNVPRADQAGLC